MSSAHARLRSDPSPTTLAISSRTVLETRAQFAHSDLQAPPTDPIGPAVSIAGVASTDASSTTTQATGGSSQGTTVERL